jgi:hypothetical protein
LGVVKDVVYEIRCSEVRRENLKIRKKSAIKSRVYVSMSPESRERNLINVYKHYQSQSGDMMRDYEK